MLEAPPPDTPVIVSTAPGLRWANPADVMQALAFALRYRGRKRIDSAVETMARITAERLLDHLKASGFVVMQQSPKPIEPDLHYCPSVRDAAQGP